MLVKGIDLPEELLRAQAAGELVVFAGAGISNPAPASLPLFNELAEMIGKNSTVANNSHDPADRYLGKLKQKGVRVHDAAAGILVNGNTHPHDLHRLLLQLFPAADKVRIVTTNFDTHFSTGAKEVIKEEVETFSGPALPLGDDFNGLIYLHGCATAPAKCVLTDEDFGRAYLTQAWASRFLAAMFSRYAVLFVGYSHDDTVMNYLARGLPPVSQKPRFTFTTDDASSLQKWEFLGIRPLIYKKTSGENEHQAITDSVREWVNELQRGLLEKSPRIQAIVVVPPPLEGEDADYIKHTLLDLDTARIFFKHAKSPEWISWLEKHQFLKPLFDRKAELKPFDWELASWLTDKFLDEHPQELMAALERHGGKLNPQFCWRLWRRLASRKQRPMSDSVFLQWIVILLGQPFDSLASDSWASLLNECEFPRDKEAAILLFDQVTKPRIQLAKAWGAFEESDTVQVKVDFELDYRRGADEYWTLQAWHKHFIPNLPAFANELEPIVISNLMAAHRLMNASRPSDRNFDSFYIHRQSIRQHEQDRVRSILDILIDAARDILDNLIRVKPGRAVARIDQWFESDISILRRLAVYGYAQRTDILPGDKLLWIEQNNIPFIFKTDVFDLIKQSYPKAPDDARRRFLEFVMLGAGIENVTSDERIKQYEVFNLVVWLHRVAPDCAVTAEKLAALKKEHPDFAEREFPDLGHWSSGARSVNTAEGLDPEIVAQRPASDFLDELLSWRPRHPFDRDRSGYCSVVSSVVSKKPEWGVGWIQVLVAKGLTDKDLWSCVCQGWRNANLAPGQWKLVLDTAEKIDAPVEFLSAFAEVLENGSRRETFTLPDELMEQAQTVAVRIWKEALVSWSNETVTSNDWLTTAINNPGGKLAEFWLQRISSARKAAGDSWRELPSAITSELREIIHGTSGASANARVIFASQLHYFFSLDSSFALSELLPLFDWQADETRAEQCWHGFLCWGRWLPGFTEQLLPYFTETIRRNAALSDSNHENLIHHIAGVALFRIDDPLANDWLPTALLQLSDSDYETFAADIDRYLGDMETTVAEKIWDRWLCRYWNMRLLNKPKRLLPKEANEMACWGLNMGRYFPDAVALTVKMAGVPTFQHTSIIHHIQQKQALAKAYPDATADLVLFYLQTPPDNFFADSDTAAVWQLLTAGGVSAEKLRKMREAFFRLGYDTEQPPK